MLEHDTDTERPIKELVGDISRDMGLLIRQEIELAKAELSEKASGVARGSIAIALGGFVAYAGILAIAAALILVLVTVGFAAWLAAAVIGALLLLIAYGMVQGGRRKMVAGPPPLYHTRLNAQQTVKQLKRQLQ